MNRLAGCRASVSFRRMLSCTGVLLVLSAAAAAAPPLADDVPLLVAPLLVSPCGAVAGADKGAAELEAASWLAGAVGAAPGAAADDASALPAYTHTRDRRELHLDAVDALLDRNDHRPIAEWPELVDSSVFNFCKCTGYSTSFAGWGFRS